MKRRRKKRKGLTIFLFSLSLAPVADAAVLLGVTALALGVLAPLGHPVGRVPPPGRPGPTPPVGAGALVSFLASIWRLSPVARAQSGTIGLRLILPICALFHSSA